MNPPFIIIAADSIAATFLWLRKEALVKWITLYIIIVLYRRGYAY